MDIMNMTLNQIIAAVPHHPLKVALFILAADNVGVSICSQMGWTKAETFLLQLSKLVYAILQALGKKIPSVPAKVLPMLLIACLFFSGCTSFNGAGMNASCGHMVGTGSYATATGSGAGFVCHEGCFGFNCPKPDYASLTTLATNYVNYSNAVTTTVPLTVAVTTNSK